MNHDRNSDFIDLFVGSKISKISDLSSKIIQILSKFSLNWNKVCYENYVPTIPS